jgi:hypothetical protein
VESYRRILGSGLILRSENLDSVRELPRPGKRERGAQGKVLVVVAAQQAAKGIGRIRLTRVPDASARSLEPAITAAIEVGSQVRTDDWRGYSGLDRLGYRRQIVRSSAEVGENSDRPVGRRLSLVCIYSNAPRISGIGHCRPSDRRPCNPD